MKCRMSSIINLKFDVTEPMSFGYIIDEFVSDRPTNECGANDMFTSYHVSRPFHYYYYNFCVSFRNSIVSTLENGPFVRFSLPHFLTISNCMSLAKTHLLWQTHIHAQYSRIQTENIIASVRLDFVVPAQPDVCMYA